MKKKKLKNISLTIEQQLKLYTEAENSTERHKIMWHEWNHNKKVLTRIQQLIYTSFPSYSMHDASHSEAVIHNIEMLLGEDNIKELTATDCFAILHTVYVHDIGMCITDEEKKEMFRDERFFKFLKDKKEFGDEDEQKYAKILLNSNYIPLDDIKETSFTEAILKDMLTERVDVFYAVVFMAAEYRRKEHGDKSKERLIKWIQKTDKLGKDFSTIEIPSRIFYVIAECAATHTNWDFEAVLDLSQEDLGYAHDYFHPRFIAVLLQLGDALDLDNNRFHPMIEEFMGKLPYNSKLHLRKHEAIRKLLITNRIIEISADCKTSDEVRLIRNEWNGIDKILRNATYYWSVIRPENTAVGLPTLEPVKLLLNGLEVPPELVNAQFEISQERAFDILKGNAIYEKTKYIFLRELLQNAIDATKLQYYRSCKRIKDEIEMDAKNPNEFNQVLKAELYPINIRFKICCCENGEIREIVPEDLDENIPEDLKRNVPNNTDKTILEKLKKKIPEENIGLLVEISDQGIGISEKDLKQISDVGTSHRNRKEEIDRMPTWLQPTGRFGIGLQSVFLCSNKLDVETKTRDNKQYNITFYPRGNSGQNGHINVIASDDNMRKYGSTFKVYVSYAKLKESNIMQTQKDYSDPFAMDSENKKKIQGIRIAIKRMAGYLAELIEEPLFPITVELYDLEMEDEKSGDLYDRKFIEQFGNVGLVIRTSDYLINKKTRYNNYEKRTDIGLPVSSDLTWAYKNIDEGDSNCQNSEDKVHRTKDGDLYYLDSETAKVYIWDAEYKAYACLGSGRVQEMSQYYSGLQERKTSVNEKPDKGIIIYYKGVSIAFSEELQENLKESDENNFNGDANLIEYIDFKDTLEKDYLYLNRNGLTEKGFDYLKRVYCDLLRLFRRALRYFSTGDDSLREIKANRNNEEKKAKPEVNKIINEIEGWMPEECTNCNKFIDIKEYICKVKDCSLNDMHEIMDEWVDLSKKQRQYIISVTALAYFSKLKERDNYVQNIDDTEKTWDKVLDKAKLFVCTMKHATLDGMALSEEKNIWLRSKLFNLEIYQTEAWHIINRSSESLSILDLVHSSNKLAIRSIKEANNSTWTKQLILLRNGEQEILKDAIQKLRVSNGSREAQESIDRIEKEYYDHLYIVDPEFATSQNSKKEQAILSWILDNVPTMAVFSNEKDTVKINVLDNEMNGSVYLNRNMKTATLKRLLKTYKNSERKIKRFSMDTWSGYHKLAVPIKDRRIHHVKKRRISNILNSKMIIPLTGKEMEEFVAECKNRIEKDMKFFEELIGIKEGIILELNTLCEEEKENIDGVFCFNLQFWKEIKYMLQKNVEGVSEEKFKSMEEEFEKINEDDKKKIAKYLLERNKDNSENITDKESIIRTIEIIAALMNQHYRNSISIEIPWMDYLNNKAFKNLQKYVMENSPCHPTDYQTWILYGNLLQEFGISVIRDEIDNIVFNKLEAKRDLFEEKEIDNK